MTTKDDPQQFDSVDSNANQLDETIILELGEAIKKLDKKWKARSIDYDSFIEEWRQNQARLKDDFHRLKRLIIKRANEGIQDEKHWERFNKYNKKTLFDPAQKLHEDIAKRLNIESNPSPHPLALGVKRIGLLALGSGLEEHKNLNQLTPPEFIETAKRVSEWLNEVLSEIRGTASIGQDLPNPDKLNIEQPRELDQEDKTELPLQSGSGSKPPSTAVLGAFYVYLELAGFFNATRKPTKELRKVEAVKRKCNPTSLANDFSAFKTKRNKNGLGKSDIDRIGKAINLLSTDSAGLGAAIKYAEGDLLNIENGTPNTVNS